MLHHLKIGKSILLFIYIVSKSGIIIYDMNSWMVSLAGKYMLIFDSSLRSYIALCFAFVSVVVMKIRDSARSFYNKVY